MRLGYLITKVDEVLGVQGELLANPVARFTKEDGEVVTVPTTPA